MKATIPNKPYYDLAQFIVVDAVSDIRDGVDVAYNVEFLDSEYGDLISSGAGHVILDKLCTELETNLYETKKVLIEKSEAPYRPVFVSSPVYRLRDGKIFRKIEDLAEETGLSKACIWACMSKKNGVLEGDQYIRIPDEDLKVFKLYKLKSMVEKLPYCLQTDECFLSPEHLAQILDNRLSASNIYHRLYENRRILEGFDFMYLDLGEIEAKQIPVCRDGRVYRNHEIVIRQKKKKPRLK